MAEIQKVLASVATGVVTNMIYSGDGSITMRVSPEVLERFYIGDTVCIIALSSLESREIAGDILRAAREHGVEPPDTALKASLDQEGGI